MFELIKRAKILTLALAIVLSLVVYLVIYRPMMQEIRHRLYINITETSTSKYSAVENAVETAITGSLSLSSRSAIRDKLAEYKNGQATLQDLKSFVQTKYAEGASVLDNLVFAQRVVDGEAIASYQAEDFNKPGLAGTQSYSNTLDYQFILSDSNLYIKVFSPIIKDGQELGVDVLLYDFSENIKEQSDAIYAISIIQPEHLKILQNDSELLMETNGSQLLRQDDNIFFTKPIDEHYFLVRANQDYIFAETNILARNIIISWIIIFAGVMTTIYLYILRYANNRIKKMEMSRDHYKNIAYTDKMTGLYSRSYLEVWKTTLRDPQRIYTLIMVDVDSFKLINDRLGHLTGDEVLKRIADIFLSSVRDSDSIIRFGGDEYLLILSYLSEEQSKSLLQRINESLNKIDDFGVPLSISFGISQLSPDIDFETALKIADERMYAAKSEKPDYQR